MPLADPWVRPLARIVVLVDLDVDEMNARVHEASARAIDDVDDRPAGPALAIARSCKRDDERHVRRERLRDRVAEQSAIRRNARRQLAETRAGARERRRRGRIRTRAD